MHDCMHRDLNFAHALVTLNALRGSVPVIQSDNLPWMEVLTMSSKDEIRIGGIAVRYLVEGHEANNTVAMFEFDVAPGGKVPGSQRRRSRPLRVVHLPAPVFAGVQL